MKVQLLSFPGCPNVDGAREALRRALAAVGLPQRFDEIDVTAAGTPELLRAWGSPTILLNGLDVAGASPSGPSCRIYEGGTQATRGVPSDDVIVRALEDTRPRRRCWVRSLAVLPPHLASAVLPLLPSVACPACIPAYAGVLSAAGLGFLFNERVLAPLIGVFLSAGVLSVAWSTRSHRRRGPLVGTILGSAAVVAGRLIWSVPTVLYGGVALLIGASLWNLWLKRPRPERLVQLRLARREGTAP